jgi:hypothetical protein
MDRSTRWTTSAGKEPPTVVKFERFLRLPGDPGKMFS